MTAFNLIDVIDLLEKANDKGIKVSFDSRELVLQVHKGRKIDKSFLNDLKSNKAHLIEYFKKHARAEMSVFGANKLQAFDKSRIDRVPLSFSQERIWFIDQLEGSVQYHLPFPINLLHRSN